MEIEVEIYVFENCEGAEGSSDEGVYSHTRWSNLVFSMMMFFKIRDQS